MIPLLACLALAHQGPLGPPIADRSAEPILRRLMDETSKLQNIEMLVLLDSHQPGEQSEAQLPYEIYLRSNSVYRLSMSGIWGDQVLYVSDGKTFLHDPLDDSQSIELKDAGKPLYEQDSSLAARGGYASPLWYFLAGSSALDKLVGKNPIVAAPAAAPYQGVKFDTSGFGSVTAFYLPGHTPELVGFKYDNLPYLKMLHSQDPADFPEPKGDAYFTQMLSVSPLKETKGMFSTEPQPGKPVSDVRKKKGN